MRASREAVARWNTAYAEQTAALFAASRSETSDATAIGRLAWAYREVAEAWRVLASELAIPLWARHAAAVAAEESNDGRRWSSRGSTLLGKES